MLGMKPKMEDFWPFEGNGVFLILVPKIRVIAGGPLEHTPSDDDGCVVS
jgi:hypothetical protein